MSDSIKNLSSLQNLLSPKDFEIITEAVNLVEKARQRGILLRIMGGVAIILHSVDRPESYDIIKKLERLGQNENIFTDIDLIGYKKQKKKIIEFFEEMGYIIDRMVLAYFGDSRLVAYKPDTKLHVDIFLDKLEFSHDISFVDSDKNLLLEKDYPTLSLADLVLEKLQIHQINEKDLKDLILLFYCHELSPNEINDHIHTKRIIDLLSDDWGFYYDAIENLNKTKLLTNELLNQNKITNDIAASVNTRISKLIEMVNSAPKTKNWQKREKIGTKKKWYRDVEELFGR